MRILGTLLADMMQLQEETNNQRRESRGLVVLQEYVVEDAAEAADLVSKLVTAARPQPGSSSSSSNASYITELTQLQKSWKKALKIRAESAAIAAAINMPAAANLVMLKTAHVQQLAEQQLGFGDALCAEVALTGLCNNPSCAALGKSNEARVITSTCSRCKMVR
jgi:hypothetical protein